MIRRVVYHPVTHMVIGICLFLSSMWQAYPTIHEDLRNFKLKSHHGAALFGFFYTLQAGLNLFDTITKAVENKRSNE